MTTRKLTYVMMAVLAMSVIAFAPVTGAEPQNDQGCYCHNNGIGVWLNGTGFNEYNGITMAAGSSVTLNVTSANIAATGVVPGIQEWLTNTTDTGKFTFQPQSVQDGSSQDHDPATGNITGMYTITAPMTSGSYTLTIFVQGTEVGVYTTVTGGSTGSGTTTTDNSGSGSTTQTSTTSKPSQDWLKGFPGLNLITLYILAGTALAIGVILGVGVALRARKVGSGAHEGS